MRETNTSVMFPSPYRGYHLSTYTSTKEESIKLLLRFRPLIGVIIFQHSPLGSLHRNCRGVSVPLSGLSSFNESAGLVDYYDCDCFRPLIGVIIFQRSVPMLIFACSHWFVSVPLSGLSSFNPTPFQPLFYKAFKGLQRA